MTNNLANGPVALRDTAPYIGCVAMTAGAAATKAGRGLAIFCSVAGNVVIQFADTSQMTIPVAANTNYEFAYSVQQIVSATATATYYNLL